MRTRLVIANGPAPAGLSFEAVSHDCSHPCAGYIDHIVSYWEDLAETTFFVAAEHVHLLPGELDTATRLARVTVEIKLPVLARGANIVVITEHIGGCPQLLLALGWKQLFGTEPPPSLRVPLRPTRVVSRAMVFRRPRKFYLNLQEDMAAGDLQPGIVEALWDYIFGQ